MGFKLSVLVAVNGIANKLIENESDFPVVVFQSENSRCLNLCKKRLLWSDHKYALRFITLHDSHFEESFKHLSLWIESQV